MSSRDIACSGSVRWPKPSSYYRGFRYSETVEVAVVLARLGYRVRNDLLVPVPVFRSRTSLLDAAIDLSVIPVAWWRVMRHQSRLVGLRRAGRRRHRGGRRVIGGSSGVIARPRPQSRAGRPGRRSTGRAGRDADRVP